MKRFRALRTMMVIAGAVFVCAQMSAELTTRRCRRVCESGLLASQQPRTPLSLFIGRLEALVGDVLLLKADNYFHGQTSILGHMRVGKCGCLDRGSRGHEHHEHEDAHEHAHHEDAHDDQHEALHHDEHEAHEHGGHQHEGHQHPGALSYDHFLYRQYCKVASAAHVHIGQHEEIVPWLYASVRLNAGNERAALVTAYWLGQELDKPREAERVLRAALAARPSSWRLRAELAWVHYRAGHFGPALRQCTSAIQLFEPAADEAQARLDQAELWRLASACQEALGDLDRAIACAELVVKFVPACQSSRERLEELKRRQERETSAGGAMPEAGSEAP